MGSFFHPQISASTEAVLRTAYGVLMALFLFQTLPQARRFFVSERWRGYAKAGPMVNVLQNPVMVWIVQLIWLSSAVALILGVHVTMAALVNFILCRYFFIHMRWKGVLRGGGAPGFMSYWLAACVLFLEISEGSLKSVALLAFKVDFAFIILSAGLYKVVSGYPKNNGMELGLVNPWWGYWWRLYRRMRPGHGVFRACNHLAYLTEIAAALLMLVPPTQFIGALLLFVSFAWIATHIRLGFLCEMVMLSCLLFVEPGSWADRRLAGLGPAASSAPAGMLPDGLIQALTICFWGYLILLPVAHIGLWYAFFSRRPLPDVVRKLLDAYTNFFGILIWRVFTVDVINFFLRIQIRASAAEGSREYTRFDRPDWTSGFRYWHVSEFVAFCSIFTTLKYYPGNAALFEDRLVRYARTIPCAPGERLIFEYYSIQKKPTEFDFVRVAEFEVDPENRTVQKRMLSQGADPSAPGEGSPIHAGVQPGSYAAGGRS